MFLRAMCFFFLLFLKTKNSKKPNQKKWQKWPKKIILIKKKNGNDFGDEIKECLFVIFASYFTGGETVGEQG